MEFLLNITIRSLLLAAMAAAGLWVFGVKTAPVRHAVWTMVTAGMQFQALLVPLLAAKVLPALPLRVLRPVTVMETRESIDDSAVVVVQSVPSRRPTMDQIAGWVYGIGVLWCAAQLVYAGWFTRRLVRESVTVGERRYESNSITVPVTVGRKILLPVGWREWDAGKLAAVLAHEAAHVARADWAVAAMARVNRCVFWFHPLAWWLERVLARLAEQVCDDAALAVLPDREKYANVLMDMARAAGSRGRRVVGAVSMAKETNVEMRINRILDASRRIISKPLGRAAWLGLSTCGAALVYVAAVVQLAPAQVPAQSKARVSSQSQATSPDAAQPQLLAQAGAQRPPARPRQAVPAAGAAIGTLSGIVLDPSGARVPNAVVTASGPGQATAATNAFGEWSLSGLPAGSYSLSVQAAGFVTNRRDGFEVETGNDLKILTNLVMESVPLEHVTIAAAGTPQAAAATPGPDPIRVGGAVNPASLVKKVFPAYPPAARDQGISGRVVIAAVIGKTGKVLDERTMNDAPHELAVAAMTAVWGWEYAPALLNGEPVETLTTITVDFQLNP